MRWYSHSCKLKLNLQRLILPVQLYNVFEFENVNRFRHADDELASALDSENRVSWPISSHFPRHDAISGRMSARGLKAGQSIFYGLVRILLTCKYTVVRKSSGKIIRKMIVAYYM